MATCNARPLYSIAFCEIVYVSWGTAIFWWSCFSLRLASGKDEEEEEEEEDEEAKEHFTWQSCSITTPVWCIVIFVQRRNPNPKWMKPQRLVWDGVVDRVCFWSWSYLASQRVNSTWLWEVWVLIFFIRISFALTWFCQFFFPSQGSIVWGCWKVDFSFTESSRRSWWWKEAAPLLETTESPRYSTLITFYGRYQSGYKLQNTRCKMPNFVLNMPDSVLQLVICSGF